MHTDRETREGRQQQTWLSLAHTAGRLERRRIRDPETPTDSTAVTTHSLQCPRQYTLHTQHTLHATLPDAKSLPSPLASPQNRLGKALPTHPAACMTQSTEEPEPRAAGSQMCERGR